SRRIRLWLTVCPWSSSSSCIPRTPRVGSPVKRRSIRAISSRFSLLSPKGFMYRLLRLTSSSSDCLLMLREHAFHQGPTLLHSLVFHKLFFKKSFSISSFPILAKTSFCSTSGSASFLPSKALEEFLRNSRFQCPIWLGCTSKCLATSPRVY